MRLSELIYLVADLLNTCLRKCQTESVICLRGFHLTKAAGNSRERRTKKTFPSDLRELVACSQVNRFMLFWYAESPADKLNDRDATRSSLFIIIPVKSDSFLAKLPPRSEDLVNGFSEQRHTLAQSVLFLSCSSQSQHISVCWQAHKMSCQQTWLQGCANT